MPRPSSAFARCGLKLVILHLVSLGLRFRSSEPLKLHSGKHGEVTVKYFRPGESVARAGIRRLVIANSHGGQPQIMDIVARDLRVRLRMLVVTLSYGALGRPPGLFPTANCATASMAGRAGPR